VTTFERPDTVSESPALMTVAEAAAMLRIGRSKAYEMARQYLATGGRDGLPVIRLGAGCLRVPRWALLVLVHAGRVVSLTEAVAEGGLE
jgi:Helix-turn-helix domain